MTVPAGTFQVHQAIGVKDSLEDVVYDISPMDTPFMSSIGKKSVSQPYHEWQTDALADATHSNAQIEGDDATGQTATPTVRYGNYCQLSWKVPQVSGTLRASDAAGRADEMSYQVTKRARELKRDIEKAISSDNGATAGAAGAGRKLAGVGTWLFGNMVNVVNNTSTTTSAISSGVPKGDVVVDASTSALTETRLKTAIQNCWTDGGNPDLVLVNAGNKAVISGFTGIATQYRQTSGMERASILGAADVYISDFGEHKIVASRWVAGTSAYVLDTEYWSVGYLRPIQQTDLAKTGDSDKKMILAEYTLIAENPDSSSKVYGITA